MINDELLHKWIEGTISEAELEAFKKRPEYESLRDLYKHTSDFSAPNFDEKAVLADVLSSKKEKQAVIPKKRPSRVFSLLKYGVAASLLLFAGWWLFTNLNSQVVYELAKGEQKEGVLPDQSTFILNAESTLSYDDNAWPENRSLKLDGEAFFTVKKGSRFTVETPNGAVEVLGTEFNVWSRDEVLEVKCQSGKVAVRSADGRIKEELAQNDALRIASGKAVEKWTLIGSQPISWIKGISSFKNVPLATVLAELERQFNVKIDASKVNAEEMISCNFQHKDLNEALKTALAAAKIQYTISKDLKQVHLYIKE